MADRYPTILGPEGYQENLNDTDNLLSPATPTADNHAANKSYVDVQDDALQDNIDALEVYVDDRDALLQSQINLLAGGSLDTRYVERAGDNIIGQITFDTDKIVLDIDGTADFASDVTIGGTASVSSTLGVGTSLTVGTTGTFGSTVTISSTITLDADGSATFAGPIEAESIDGGTY